MVRWVSAGQEKGESTYVIVFKVGAQDASAELTDIGDDEGGAELGPRNEMC